MGGKWFGAAAPKLPVGLSSEGMQLFPPTPPFFFLPSLTAKKGVSGVSSDSSGKDLSSYKTGFGSFVLLCNFVIRNKPLALTE